MSFFPPIATAAAVMFCATIARSQTLTPFLLQDVDSATEAHTQQITFENAPAGYDDVFYISDGPTPGLWHTGSGDVGDFFVSDAYVAQTIGSLTFFWGYGAPVTLHVADGSTAATRTIGQFPGFHGGAPCGTKICFSAGNNLVGVSDGTAAGSAIIASTEPAVADSVFPRDFASTGKSVYFSGFDLAHGDCVSGNGNTFCGELLTSDGTAAGTYLVSDIIPGPFPSAPEGLVAWNGKIYFNAFGTDDLNRYFYVSDGTNAGTRRLTKLATVARGGGGAIVGAGKYVYLLPSQYQWWRTDGTPESTVQVRDLVNIADPALNALILDLIASPQAILFT